MPHTLGDILCIARQARGLTVEQVADAWALLRPKDRPTPRAVLDIENDHIVDPQARRRIATRVIGALNDLSPLSQGERDRLLAAAGVVPQDLADALLAHPELFPAIREMLR